MKTMLTIGLLTLYLAAPSVFSQAREAPKEKILPVSLISLIANPEKYDGKVVSTWGYLSMRPWEFHSGILTVLYLHEEDAENLLMSNGVVVIQNREMVKHEKELNRTYVHLVGKFKTRVLTDVQSCTVYSDPKHPIGERSPDPSRRVP